MVVACCALMPARTSALFAALFAVSASASAQQVIPLWQAGAPGFEARRDEPEQHQDWWYKNIHNPSLTVFLPPAGKNSGTAVIVAAGGRNTVSDGLWMFLYHQSWCCSGSSRRASKPGAPFCQSGMTCCACAHNEAD